MRYSPERVTVLSKRLVDRLVTEELIKPKGGRAELEASIQRIITEELSVELRLDDEVRQIMRTYQDEIDKGNLDYAKVFQMVKKKLVKDRGMVL